jgi:hypothetical protein
MRPKAVKAQKSFRQPNHKPMTSISNQITLVGNLGSGQIATFNATSGNFEGMLNDQNDQPITIAGLWGIAGNNQQAGPANALYFCAGPSFIATVCSAILHLPRISRYLRVSGRPMNGWLYSGNNGW